MYQVLLVFHVLIALGVVGLVLLQQGRGAEAGAGFSGASSTLFGARGAASFLSRTTATMGALFFATTLALAYLASNKDNKSVDIMDAPSVDAVHRDLPPVVDTPSDAGKKADDIPSAPVEPKP